MEYFINTFIKFIISTTRETLYSSHAVHTRYQFYILPFSVLDISESNFFFFINAHFRIPSEGEIEEKICASGAN